jgi:outer membrane protein OmpA-like peptidoglycan-associated protein
MWLAMVLAAGLAGCSPIETLRSMRGLDKNDPDPATTPFGDNIAKSEAGPYPNLASVPPPPVVTSTAAERKKLADNLTIAGTSAQAPDARGIPGTPATGPVPPPPPLPPALASAQSPAEVGPPPEMPQPTAVPARKQDEPALPGPLASTVQSPQARGMPRPEPLRPPAPQGTPSAMPVPDPSVSPAAAQTGNPLPSPAQPVLAPAVPSPEAAARPAPKAPPVGMTVAALDMPVGATGLTPDDRGRISQVLAQYQQKPRTVRVVAYAAPAGGSAEQLNSFRAALDRAQMVANQLTGDGIPATKIQTEAAPAGAAKPVGRIEVQLLP